MKKDYIKDIKGAERRFIAPKIEVREDGDNKEIRGQAAIVDSWTDLGWYEEKLEKGAFDDVLKDDVRALFNHDSNLILARSINGKGTLKLSTTKEGHLSYSYSTPNRSYAKDLEDAIKAGDVSQSSFAFTVKEEKWEFATRENKLEKDRRTIIKLERLFDVSPVTYPAYQDTTVAARSKEATTNKDEEIRKQQDKDYYEYLSLKNRIK